LKLPLTRYFDVLRFAPSGHGFEIAAIIKRALTNHPLPATGLCFDIGEFNSFDQFETKYRELATELGYAGKVPPPGELDFLHAMVEKENARYPGGISSRDYFFLTALVSIIAPRRVVEIGTLTGFSAAIIAAAIHRQHPTPVIPSEVEGPRGRSRDPASPITIETIDALTYCLIDETKEVGFEIPNLIPDLASTVRIHTGHESDYVRELAARDELGLAFIDADHRHPWPLLDVLRLAPYLRGGGWIVLHDIQLGTYGKEMQKAGKPFESTTPFGAEWLFERWPFRKIRSLHIGAIEIPTPKSALIPFALDLMEQPIEVIGDTAKRTRRALYQSFTDLV
jgi:predicted O-methyltransferase YrrM